MTHLPVILGLLLPWLAFAEAETEAWFFPKPAPAEDVNPTELAASWEKGRDFLLREQHPAGYWGSPQRTKDLNIWAPVPGAHQAFRSAVTAMCLRALLESPGPTPEEEAACRRAAAWLLETLPSIRRPHQAAIYNIWAHAYGLQALIAWQQRHPADKDAVAEVVTGQIQWLQRFASVDGGWAYYDFRAQTRTPSGHPNSFVTAVILIALDQAREAGYKVPETLTDKALRSLRLQCKPDFTYLYSLQFRFYPMRTVNRPGGSLGRTLACNLARQHWDDPRISEDLVTSTLNRFIGRHGWMDMARKRPVPHESWFAVAGYYYYFGQYYAARSMQTLPAEQRGFYQQHLARLLIDRQETNGSWWDFPLYDYHPYYGTAYALMALAACQPGAPQVTSLGGQE